MKILKSENQGGAWPKKITCEYCHAELEIEKDDVFEGVLGMTFVNCPVCKRDIDVDCPELETVITCDNLRFPKHFFYSGDGVDIEESRILDMIREGVKYFRENPEEYAWTTQIGNTYIAVHNYLDDKEYEVIVSKDYYNTFIPYETEDYRVYHKNLIKKEEQ